MSDTPGGDLERLRSIPLFRDLDDAALTEVAGSAAPFEVAQGHVLVQPGRPGEGLFLIEEGSATVELPDGRVDLGPGEFFGELALLTDAGIHIGRVSARSALRGRAIRRDDLDELLEAQPKIALAMLRALAARLAADAPHR